MIDRIDSALAGLPAPYIRNMWGYCLEHADHGDAEVSRSEQCDAIPYVPVLPESLGLDLTAGSLVLDIGCLGGYGLYDFMLRRERAGLPLPAAVGMDVDPVSIRVADALRSQWATTVDVRFVKAGCERIPLEDASVDLIVARLVLPYLPLRASVAEMVRVLKPGGAVLIQTHAPRYYWRNLRNVFPRLKRMVYYAKPLVGGMVFALTGRQIGRETALGRKLVQNLFLEHGMACIWNGGFESKPLMAFKRGGRRRAD